MPIYFVSRPNGTVTAVWDTLFSCRCLKRCYPTSDDEWVIELTRHFAKKLEQQGCQVRKYNPHADGPKELILAKLRTPHQTQEAVK